MAGVVPKRLLEGPFQWVLAACQHRHPKNEQELDAGSRIHSREYTGSRIHSRECTDALYLLSRESGPASTTRLSYLYSIVLYLRHAACTKLDSLVLVQVKFTVPLAGVEVDGKSYM